MFTAEVPQGTGYKTIASVASNYSWADDLVAKMIQQDPDARPQSVEQIKLGMLAYEREFVTRQKLNALEKTVVPVSMDDDPLLADPPRVVDFSYNNGTLTIILSRTVNPLWIWAFRNMSGYQYHNDKSPASFRLKDDRAEIQNVHEKEVQMTIDDFKLWIPFAMTKYKERIDSDRRAEVAALHEKLRLEREDLERQQRLRKNIRI
jgi:serine/threonine protein kinase